MLFLNFIFICNDFLNIKYMCIKDSKRWLKKIKYVVFLKLDVNIRLLGYLSIY